MCGCVGKGGLGLALAVPYCMVYYTVAYSLNLSKYHITRTRMILTIEVASKLVNYVAPSEQLNVTIPYVTILVNWLTLSALELSQTLLALRTLRPPFHDELEYQYTYQYHTSTEHRTLVRFSVLVPRGSPGLRALCCFSLVDAVTISCYAAPQPEGIYSNSGTRCNGSEARKMKGGHMNRVLFNRHFRDVAFAPDVAVDAVGSVNGNRRFSSVVESRFYC